MSKSKQKEWQIEWLDVNSVTPYENNARKNDDTVPYLINSIKRFGFRVPLVIDKDSVVICGHTRLKAALEIGMEKVPCVRADDLTKAEIKAFRLADNKIAEMSGWDFEKLESEMESLGEEFGDLTEFGFEKEEDDDDDFMDEEGEVPFSEELREEHNYVVLYFDNDVDWLQAQTLLGLKSVKALDSKKGFEKIGVGRVLRGAYALEKIREGLV